MSKKDRQGKAFSKKSKEPLLTRIIKYLMLLLFGYGVIFWSGVAVLSLLNDTYEEFEQPVWVGAVMVAGIAFVTAAMVLSVKRKYIISFALSACGSAAMLICAGWFVKTARHELETRAVSADLLGLDKRYMYRAVPVLAGAVLSLVLAAIGIARMLKKRKEKKLEKQNAPVKSIID